MGSAVRIDVWSDIVCPWCYIGKRRLEAAIAASRETHPSLEVELVYHAFQLDPRAPVGEDQL
ncbi:MAG: DsbA family oxidoreductase, partial [Acidimicrobiales bacterium]|nr:DsbA family oxidoreductase [Acidimicrobiales bacterium]